MPETEPTLIRVTEIVQGALQKADDFVAKRHRTGSTRGLPFAAWRLCRPATTRCRRRFLHAGDPAVPM